MRRVMLLAALAIASTLVATPAVAIFPPTPDGTGHPNVGILVAEWRTPGVKDRICSGTLIAPRIFLTAAHCDVSSEGVPPDQYYVSFDPVYEFENSTLYRGTFIPNPDFRDYVAAGATANDPNDVAIVRLQDGPSVTPAALPTAGLLSSLDLRGQQFTVVGYGRTRIDKTKGPNNIVTQFARNVGSETFRSLQPLWLMQDANPSTGNDTTCYGDSGGPHFLDDSNTIVAVTATGDIPCRANDVSYRLDTPSARGYLAAQGIPLP
jgi:secreted trypsin-like serine protease